MMIGQKVIYGLIGGIAGTIASKWILLSIHWATEIRLTYPLLIWGLPLLGFLIGITQDFPQMRISWQCLGPGLSHLTGASTGRESSAIHLSKSLSDQIWKIVFKSQELPVPVKAAAMAAGFSGALGAPIAGVLFSMETSGLPRTKYLNLDIIPPILASLIAHLLVTLTGRDHWTFTSIPMNHFSAENLHLLNTKVIACFSFGILAGLVSAFFSLSIKKIRKKTSDLIPNPALAGAIGGTILLFLLQLNFNTPFQGLGLNTIESFFTQPADWSMPVGKLVMSILSIGFGLMGGEFIPLVFIGTGMGSTLAPLLGVNASFMSSLGFSSLYAGTNQAPWACIALIFELFNWQMALFAAISCIISAKIHLLLTKLEKPKTI